MSKTTLDNIDKIRGNLPRSHYIESMLEVSSNKKILNRNEIKRNSVVYTPKILSKYVADKVFSYFINDKLRNDNKGFIKSPIKLNLNKLRILDPACGNGDFKLRFPVKQ